MTTDNKKMTIDDFEKKYTLVKNHLDEHASFDGCMFETHGEELEYVLEQVKGNKVWTVIDCSGWYGITAGYHWVNRLGYLITEESWMDDSEEYVISNEGPVNDWFFDLSVEEQKSLFPDLKIDDCKDLEDQLEDAWHDNCVDEKEEIMEKFKTDK